MMQFTEPQVEFIEFDTDVLASDTSGTKCTDTWLGGILTCEGTNMAEMCGVKMAALS